MSTSVNDQIICRDEFIIHAPPSQVALFIGDAQRILDYYPAGFRACNIVLGQQLACYSYVGASLLERDNSQSSDSCLVFKAYNCVASSKNRSADEFKQQAFFTMFEDWQLQAYGENGQLTQVIKTWRNLERQRLFFIPKSLLIVSVKLTAKLERRVLVRSWNREARKQA